MKIFPQKHLSKNLQKLSRIKNSILPLLWSDGKMEF